jgi:hypothetical protein
LEAPEARKTEEVVRRNFAHEEVPEVEDFPVEELRNLVHRTGLLVDRRIPDEAAEERLQVVDSSRRRLEEGKDYDRQVEDHRREPEEGGVRTRSLRVAAVEVLHTVVEEAGRIHILLAAEVVHHNLGLEEGRGVEVRRILLAGHSQGIDCMTFGSLAAVVFCSYLGSGEIDKPFDGR